MAEQVRDFEKTVVCVFSHGTSGGLRTHKKTWDILDILLGKIEKTTSRRSPEPWNHGFYKGNHPQMALAEQFRLVKYDNLPRY